MSTWSMLRSYFELDAWETFCSVYVWITSRLLSPEVFLCLKPIQKARGFLFHFPHHSLRLCPLYTLLPKSKGLIFHKSDYAVLGMSD